MINNFLPIGGQCPSFKMLFTYSKSDIILDNRI